MAGYGNDSKWIWSDFIFIPLVSVLYTIFREFVYLRLKEKHIKQVTKTVVEEYTAEEIADIDGKCKKE